MKKLFENMFKIGFVVTMIGGTGLDSDNMVIPLVVVCVGLVMIGMGAFYGMERH